MQYKELLPIHDVQLADSHKVSDSQTVALVSNASIASKGFLDGTGMQFGYNTRLPWGIKLAHVTSATQCLVSW
jgi:hypothetical protein